MSCEDPIYLRCGTTFVLDMSLEDAADNLTYFDGLSARGTIVDLENAEVLALDSSHFAITTGATGGVLLTIDSDTTPSVSPQNERRDLMLYVELYDGSTPPVITPYALVPIVAVPDLTP